MELEPGRSANKHQQTGYFEEQEWLELEYLRVTRGAEPVLNVTKCGLNIFIFRESSASKNEHIGESKAFVYEILITLTILKIAM